ncbi:MAG TPA: TIGR02996 domain-containing protein [Gemmataceae bacterium]|jgi:uncharacterized protein (TIGR02996 family)|nr:TIGR02996 domain-containing protein [Gemmataceae bacterium]
MPPDGHEPFLATILENPDDDAPRLVYADWLEEQGDSRGEFIRVQCELARLEEDDPRAEILRDRENNLLLAHGDKWREELPEWARAKSEFRRGFIEEVTLWRSDIFSELNLLPHRAPVRRLVLEEVAGKMSQFRLSAAMEFATELCFLDNRLQFADLREMLEAPFTEVEYATDLSRLRSLTFLGTSLLDGGAARIAMATELANLRRLELVRCQMTAHGLQQIFHCQHLPKLTWLDLSENLLFDSGAWQLARSEARRGLTHLSLRDVHLGNHGARHIAESSILENLQCLDVSQNGIGDDGAKALAKGLPNLRRLAFRENYATASGLLALQERFRKGLKL